MRSRTWAGQLTWLLQRDTASPGPRTASEPHAGQAVGITNSRSAPVRSSTSARTTSGITSPARCTITRSPIRTSLRRISSSLCSVARDTVTPPTYTGSRSADGVSAPVRPTVMMMSRTVVVCCSGGNFIAIAHRGARDTNPNRSCSA